MSDGVNRQGEESDNNSNLQIKTQERATSNQAMLFRRRGGRDRAVSSPCRRNSFALESACVRNLKHVRRFKTFPP